MHCGVAPPTSVVPTPRSPRGGVRSLVESLHTMAQPEARLQRNIQKALREEFGHAILVFKIHGGPMMMAGLPDLIGVIAGRFFGIEVKMPESIDNVSVIQQHVHARIRRAGGSVTVSSSVADALAFVRQVQLPDRPRRRVTGDLSARHEWACPSCGATTRARMADR